MVSGIEMTGDIPNHINGECEVCLKGKTTQNIISKKLDVENLKGLDKVYSDVCGPFDVKEYS